MFLLLQSNKFIKKKKNICYVAGQLRKKYSHNNYAFKKKQGHSAGFVLRNSVVIELLSHRDVLWRYRIYYERLPMHFQVGLLS